MSALQRHLLMVFAVSISVAFAMAILWFARGPWDVVWENRYLQFLAWFVTISSTVLSFIGISLRELVRGPQEVPLPHPDVLVSRKGDTVDLEFIVTNHGTCPMRDVQLDIFGSPDSLPFAHTGRVTRKGNPIPPGGAHWASWSLKPSVAIATLNDPAVRLRLRAYCTDEHGRRFQSEEHNFAGPELIAKSMP